MTGCMYATFHFLTSQFQKFYYKTKFKPWKKKVIASTQQKLIGKAMIKFFLAAAVALGFMATGYGADCTTENIIIGTQRTGRVFSGQPEWKVSVINNCTCTQRALVLSCSGFQTVERVDPNIFSKQGDGCLVANGNPISPFSSVSFSYAWYPPFILMPKSSTVIC